MSVSHTGSTARAFTVGNNIAFNSGEYDPSSAEGQHVLAHELAHVRQQTDGAVSMLPQDDVQLEIDPDPKLEEEAEETAQRVMQGGKLDIQRIENTDVHVQRYPGEGYVDTAGEWAQNKASEFLDSGEEAIDEATTKKYRFSKSELKNLIQSVKTEAGLAEYLEHKDIDPTSSLQETAGGAMGMAGMGWRHGSLLGSFTPIPYGSQIGGAAFGTVYGILSNLYGEDAAGKIQHYIRDTLGLNTDQEFDVSDETGLGDSQGVGGSQR